MKAPKFIRFILLSLGLHLLITLCVYLYRIEIHPPAIPPISLELIESPASSVAQKSLQKVRPLQQQLVEQNEKAINDETPVETRFLSRNNQVVKKQTVAINKGDFQNLGKTAPQTKGEFLGEKKAQKSKPTLKDLTPQIDAFAVMQKQVADENAKREQIQKGAMFGESNPQADSSQSPDYLKDVDQGLETMLSTKEFKYYTYFNRIRRQLSQHWEPKVRDKLNKIFREGRTIASDEDKITRLVIFLNPAGNLVKVQVLSESGVRDLDEAAIEAFKSAAPFPNPPRGIVDADGTVKIRWDFVLQS